MKINAGQHTLMRVLYTPEMMKRLEAGVRDRTLVPEVRLVFLSQSYAQRVEVGLRLDGKRVCVVYDGSLRVCTYLVECASGTSLVLHAPPPIMVLFCHARHRHYSGGARTRWLSH